MKKYLTLLLISLLVLAGCGSDEPEANASESEAGTNGEVTELTFWTPEVENRETINNMINDFNSAHENIEIKPEFFDDEAYKTRLRVAIAGNQMPDLFFYWSGDAFRSLVDAGLVADINDELNEDSAFADRVLPGGLDAFTVDGNRYGLPSDAGAVNLYYNKDIFAENNLTPPQTYDELLQVVDQLNELNIIPITVAGRDRWPVLHWFSYLSQRIGGTEPFEKVQAGEGDFTQESFIKAGEKLQDLAIGNEAFVNGFLGLDYAAAEALFINERAAMYMQGDWTIPTFASNNAFVDKVGYIPFPEFEDGEGSSLYFHGGFAQGYSISASIENKDAAYQAIKYLSEHREGLIEKGLPGSIQGVEVDESNMTPLAYEYIQYINEVPEGFFGFYDQQLAVNTADELLNAVMAIVSGGDVYEQLSQVNVE